MTPAPRPRLLRPFLVLASAVLCFCAASAVIDTMRWPLVGDASLIHYLCFLMDHGMAPYRDLGDMNMPGSFMVEWTAMHALGMGARAWRAYDLLLMTIAGAAIFSIIRTRYPFAALFAATLFYLVHQRDGFAQGGQRDLTMAVVLLLATAALLQALRRNSLPLVALFGLSAGLAITIKPTALLFALGLGALALYSLRRRADTFRFVLLTAVLAAVIPLSGAYFFLIRHAALRAFLQGLRTVVPYYASLGHRSLGYLLTHSISPLLPLILLWLVLLSISRPQYTLERIALFGGALFGLISYVVQARGFPYYRYPLLAFLLPLIGMDLTAALNLSTSKLGRLFAVSGIAVGALFIAPVSAWSIHQYDPANLDFITSLEGTLNRVGGPELSGHVQCVDSVSGCGTTLYRMRLIQSTGVLSDFLLFGPPDKRVVRETRATFLTQITQTPPSVIIVTSPLHIDGPGNYAKLDLWPEFRDVLVTRYCLVQDWSPTRPQRWWSRPQMPAGFRVYTLRASKAAGCTMSRW